MPLADISYGKGILHGAAHIRSMREDQQPSIGADHRLDGVQPQASVRKAGDPVKCYALLGQPLQGAHHGVVFH